MPVFNLPEGTLNDPTSGSAGMVVAGSDSRIVTSHRAKTIQKSGLSGELWYAPQFDSNLVFIRPNDYFGEVPTWAGTSSNANARSIRSYCEQFLIAEAAGQVQRASPVAGPNVDDSYSLRDITEFHPEIASVTLPREYVWIDENTLQPRNGFMTFEPESRWVAEFEDGEGNEVLVRDDERFATGSEVTLVRLQNVISAEDVRVYTDDMQTDEFTDEAFAYGDEVSYEGRQVVEEWTSSESVSGYTVNLKLIFIPDNIETESIESQYRIEKTLSNSEDNPRGYALVTSWTRLSSNLGQVFSTSSQTEAETEFEEAKERANQFIDDENSLAESAEEESRIGTEVWSESITGGDFSTSPGKEINYTAKYVGEGKYSVSRNALVIDIFEAATDEEASTRAATVAATDANPEPISYAPETWRSYVDSIDAWKLDPTANPLPDDCPFYYLSIKGGYDWAAPGTRDRDLTSLMGIDYDAQPTPSGMLRLKIRAGYGVTFKMTTENAHYFHANFKGVSGNWATVEVDNPDVEIHVPPATINPSDTVTFTLKATTHDDAWLEIDTDAEWSNVDRFQMSSLGEKLVIEDPAKIDDEWYLEVLEVKQYPISDPGEPKENGDETPKNGEGNGDLITGLAIAAAVGIGIYLLFNFTKAGEE